MSKTVLAVAVLLMTACAPKAEEAAPPAEAMTPAAPPAVVDSAAAMADTMMARDTTKM